MTTHPSRLYAGVCIHCDHQFIPSIGQNHTFIGIHGVHTVFRTGKSPYIRSHTVYIYSSGQPYSYHSLPQMAARTLKSQPRAQMGVGMR